MFHSSSSRVLPERLAFAMTRTTLQLEVGYEERSKDNICLS